MKKIAALFGMILLMASPIAWAESAPSLSEAMATARHIFAARMQKKAKAAKLENASSTTPMLAQVPSGESYFQQLKEFYGKGRIPTQQELTGWFTGRCYNNDARNTAVRALIVGYFDSQDDNGPLFPQKQFLENQISLAGFTPDYFDRLTADKIQGIKELFPDGNLPAKEAAGSIVFDYDNGNIEYRVRKFRSYLIVNDVLIKSGSLGKAGDTVSMCYFFKKVHD